MQEGRLRDRLAAAEARRRRPGAGAGVLVGAARGGRGAARSSSGSAARSWRASSPASPSCRPRSRASSRSWRRARARPRPVRARCTSSSARPRRRSPRPRRRSSAPRPLRLEAREAAARLEARLERAEAEAAGAAEALRARLGTLPEDAEQAAPDGRELAELESELARLGAVRERLGPVNLRAIDEAAELALRIETMAAEQAELAGAIERLRRAITTLNREGRERLRAAFAQVERHFEALFTRLFGGGRARLALTDQEDPFAAGLELAASPPGKKLQSVSLLSGGEKALTALALIFAVFLTKPAPLCVLDEVDAPLDDANVERLMALLEELAEGTRTRFLVVTHHPLTMARMHRLYGVTMAERGISQLVSVDLTSAVELRATA